MILNEFYKALLAQLITNNDIGLNHFDRFNDNVEEEDEEISFNLPAAFLELPQNIEWRSVGRHKQIGVCEFNIILLVEILLESDSNATEDERDTTLSADNLVDGITRYLTALTGSFFGSISRTGTVMDHSYDNLREIIIPFKTLLIDKAAMRTFVKRGVNPGSISLEVE